MTSALDRCLRAGDRKCPAPEVTGLRMKAVELAVSG